MSAVGTTVYFMGDGLAPNSSIVHCDLSLYAVSIICQCREMFDAKYFFRGQPWNPSSRNLTGRLKSLIFPDSQPQSPVDETLSTIHSSPPTGVTVSSGAPCAPAVLPSYGSSPSPLNLTVASFLFFTPYRILHEAKDDAQFERIRNSLAGEWATCAMTVSTYEANSRRKRPAERFHGQQLMGFIA